MTIPTGDAEEVQRGDLDPEAKARRVAEEIIAARRFASALEALVPPAQAARPRPPYAAAPWSDLGVRWSELTMDDLRCNRGGVRSFIVNVLPPAAAAHIVVDIYERQKLAEAGDRGTSAVGKLAPSGDA